MGFSNNNFDGWELKMQNFVCEGEQPIETFTLSNPKGHFFEYVKITLMGNQTIFSGDWGEFILNSRFSPKYRALTDISYVFSKLPESAKEGMKVFSPEMCKNGINEIIANLEDYTSDPEKQKELKEQFEELLTYVDDQLEYTYHAFRGDIDWESEDMPLYYDFSNWFKINIDAFNKINEIYTKTTKEVIKNIQKSNGELQS